jgi:putative flippase GtrA
LPQIKKQWLVIPAYKPNYNLIDLVYQLISISNVNILIVDDGSPNIYSQIFELIDEFNETLIIKNQKNLGKGASLKKAFRYLLRTYNKKINGVITADADGQHDAFDINKLILKSKKFSEALIIGTRNFSNKNIPFRSKFGNILTKEVFFVITRKFISDTQSGLRYIPKKIMVASLDIPYNQYDFEQEFLLRVATINSAVHYVTIKTIYKKENISSHFRPIIDSLRIYYVFIRHTLTSIFTSFIDYLAFIFCYFSTGSILTSIVTGRFISLIFNFTFSKKYVYKFSNLNNKITLKYLLIVVLMTTISYFSISLLNTQFDLNVIISKIIIESIFFLINFLNMRFIVFRKLLL